MRNDLERIKEGLLRRIAQTKVTEECARATGNNMDAADAILRRMKLRAELINLCTEALVR